MIAGMAMGEHSEYLKPFGDLFIRLIKMLVVPLVFFSLIAGITAMKDPAMMGRIGIKTTIAYMTTTIFAISIGFTVALIIRPGEGVVIPMSGEKYTPPGEPQTITQMLLNIVPTNPVAAFTEGNMLQIIFFAIMCGVSLTLLGKKSDNVTRLNNTLAEMMYKMTNIVMSYAPIGVFALIAWVAGTYGVDTLIDLLKLAIAMVIGVVIHAVLVYGGVMYFALRLNPLRFIKHIANPLAVAFSTASSSATLPVTLKAATEKVGVSRETASFVLPLGATINMDGSALYQGMVAIFVAQAAGVDLTTGNYITIMLIATLGSIGTAGIPSASFVMISVILSTLGLPLEAIPLILAIDRLLDMIRTAVNVTGDAFVSVLVDKTEGRFDEGKFHL